MGCGSSGQGTVGPSDRDDSNNNTGEHPKTNMTNGHIANHKDLKTDHGDSNTSPNREKTRTKAHHPEPLLETKPPSGPGEKLDKLCCIFQLNC